MKWLILVPAVFGLIGCAPPRPEFKATPTPAPEAVAGLRAVQSRVLPLGLKAVFPKVLEVLLDHGYQIRSANEQLGLVSFFQQWTDSDRLGAPAYSQEGTLVFQPVGAGSTRLRVLITGRSEENVGKNAAFMAGPQRGASPEQYRQLLDFLEQALQAQE